MATDIYVRLAKHMDKLPGGYPSTESGVELKILKKLYSVEDAKLALKLTLLAEPVPVLARRSGLSIEDAAEKYEDMAQRGLIFRMRGKSGPKYMAANFVVGVWEFQVERLDKELVTLMNEYIPSLVDAKTWKKSPQLRTIPVDRSITPTHEALDYEQAGNLIKKAKKILVAPCICRREHKMVGTGCDKLEEACLIFDWSADYYEKNSIGRMIDEEEALAILAEGEKQGLVVQPSNSQKAVNICMCCGCCCQVLLALKRHPDPADMIASVFVAKVDEEKCVGCTKCIDRCQMDALKMVPNEAGDDKAVLDTDSCIGCGLCVTSCGPEAIALERSGRKPKVPRHYHETMYNLGKARGKIGPVRATAMVLKSKFDRLMASEKKS